MSTFRFRVIACVPLLVAAGGCAAAYHAYPDGCVPCAYCPAEPLPYATYRACATPIAVCGETKTSNGDIGLAPDQSTTAATDERP